MNKATFLLAFLANLLSIGVVVGTWLLLDWIRDKVGLAPAFVCAFILIALCVTVLARPNA